MQEKANSICDLIQNNQLDAREYLYNINEK